MASHSSEQQLSSQIQGLKRAAAANRAKSTLAGQPVPNGTNQNKAGGGGGSPLLQPGQMLSSASVIEGELTSKHQQRQQQQQQSQPRPANSQTRAQQLQPAQAMQTSGTALNSKQMMQGGAKALKDNSQNKLLEHLIVAISNDGNGKGNQGQGNNNAGASQRRKRDSKKTRQSSINNTVKEQADYKEQTASFDQSQQKLSNSQNTRPVQKQQFKKNLLGSSGGPQQLAAGFLQNGQNDNDGSQNSNYNSVQGPQSCKTGRPLSRQSMQRYGTQGAIPDSGSIGGSTNLVSQQYKSNGRASSQHALQSSNSAGNPPQPAVSNSQVFHQQQHAHGYARSQVNASVLIKQDSHGRSGRNQTQDMTTQKNMNQLIKKTPGHTQQKSITRIQSSKRNNALTQSVDQKSAIKAGQAINGGLAQNSQNSQQVLPPQKNLADQNQQVIFMGQNQKHNIGSKLAKSSFYSNKSGHSNQKNVIGSNKMIHQGRNNALGSKVFSGSSNQPNFTGGEKQFKRSANPQVIQNLQGGNGGASANSKEVYQVYLNNFQQSFEHSSHNQSPVRVAAGAQVVIKTGGTAQTPAPIHGQALLFQPQQLPRLPQASSPTSGTAAPGQQPPMPFQHPEAAMHTGNFSRGSTSNADGQQRKGSSRQSQQRRPSVGLTANALAAQQNMEQQQQIQQQVSSTTSKQQNMNRPSSNRSKSVMAAPKHHSQHKPGHTPFSVNLPFVPQDGSVAANQPQQQYSSLGVTPHAVAQGQALSGSAKTQMLNQTQMVVANVMSPAGRFTQMDQYQQNAIKRSQLGGGSIRQSKPGTGSCLVTYQSLSAELEQEKSGLEEMHMFFVAFHTRQRKIIEAADRNRTIQQKADSKKNSLYQVQLGSQSVNEKVKQERALQGKTEELNVDILEQEVTLDM